MSDGKTYVTTYTYDGDSTRIASITNGDGTRVQITYELMGADYKVTTLTDGENKQTTFDYSVPNQTTLTDPLGAGDHLQV